MTEHHLKQWADTAGIDLARLEVRSEASGERGVFAGCDLAPGCQARPLSTLRCTILSAPCPRLRVAWHHAAYPVFLTKVTIEGDFTLPTGRILQVPVPVMLTAGRLKISQSQAEVKTAAQALAPEQVDNTICTRWWLPLLDLDSKLPTCCTVMRRAAQRLALFLLQEKSKLCNSAWEPYLAQLPPTPDRLSTFSPQEISTLQVGQAQCIYLQPISSVHSAAAAAGLFNPETASKVKSVHNSDTLPPL